MADQRVFRKGQTYYVDSLGNLLILDWEHFFFG